MSLQLLRENIADVGFAHALIYLNRLNIQKSDGSLRIEGGRVIRTAASYRPEMLEELKSIFASGWNQLRKQIDINNVDPALLTPVVRQLLQRRDDAAQKFHMQHLPHLAVVFAILNKDGLDQLEDHPSVAEIHFLSNDLELIHPLPPTKEQAEPDTGTAWGLTMMGAPQLWAMGYTGKDIHIAHLDTGIESRHPALQRVLDEKAIFDLDGTLETAPITMFSDTGWHGTHTAGTLACRNTDKENIVGMATDSKLNSAIVIEHGQIGARVLSGLEWALSSGARILNLSVAFPGWNGSFQTVVQTMRDQELLPVIAAGNYSNKSCSPGNYETAFSVGAVGVTKYVSPSSSHMQRGQKGVGPVLCAPGVNVKSTAPGNSYELQSGTSMAAPHVAGLAALLFEAVPSATIDQVQLAITSSCTNPVAEDPVRIGAGIPCGPTALAALKLMVPG